MAIKNVIGCRPKLTWCTQVTWVEHAEYDEAAVHPLYRPLLRSGMALGAPRWVAALQRQCQSLAILMSSLPTDAANSKSQFPEMSKAEQN